MMRPTMKAIRELAMYIFKTRPNKKVGQIIAFIYWWQDRDIIFFDLKHYMGRIVHTSEFDIDDVIVTIHLVKE